jgi:hypothetical protein
VELFRTATCFPPATACSIDSIILKSNTIPVIGPNGPAALAGEVNMAGKPHTVGSQTQMWIWGIVAALVIVAVAATIYAG